MRVTGSIAILMAGVLVPPVAAQSPHATIAAPANKPYRMRNSKLTVPPVLDAMRRVAIRQLGDDELDVYAVYENGSDAITVYAYRNVIGSVPVWFDRARAAVEERTDVYGTATPVAAPAAFTPPGQATASGLMGAWSISKPPYRGTALALLPMNGWLVKVRYSSTTLDGPGVAARMPAVLAALDWPHAVAAAPVAVPVADCATPLAFPTVAEPVRDRQALAMAAVAGGLTMAAAAAGPAAVPANWCRDPARPRFGAAYRADGADDAYLLAFSDAGRGLWVQRDIIGEEVAQSQGAPARRWTITLYEMGHTALYPPMTALPRPDQVIDSLNGPSMAQVATWGRGKRRVEINGAFVR